MRTEEYTVSHDPSDAPRYNHRIYLCESKYVGKILCIEDIDKTHYPFLRQWHNMEIDINNQWSLNNGTLALNIIIHKDGRHKMQYMVRLKTKDVKIILSTKLNAIGICDERRRVLLHLSPLKIKQLFEFYKMKISTDKFIKHHHLSPKGWSIE